jgi:NAD dependent epimerase/dehydratase
MKKKILITGADGFIGSHVVDKFLSLNYEVKAFVMYNSFNSTGWINENNKKLEIFFGDIRDSENVEKSMKNCDTVLHLAALNAIPYSYFSSQSFIDTNLKGTLNILQSAKKTGISKIILTSTSEVYGNCIFSPMTESHPTITQSPYAASKHAADQLALSFYKSFDLPISILRPFNAYGPRQSLRAIIPTIIMQILNKNKKIFLGNIDTYRDFNFVEDIANSFYKLYKSKNKKIFGEIFNVGTGSSFSIKEIFLIISDIIGHRPILSIKKNRIRPKKSEVTKLIASNKKIKKYINWSPEYYDIKGFKKGLIKTIDWYKQNISKFKNIIFSRNKI